MTYEWWFRIKFSRVRYYCPLIVLPFYFTWKPLQTCESLVMQPSTFSTMECFGEKASVDLPFNMRMPVPRHYYYCPFTVISFFVRAYVNLRSSSVSNAGPLAIVCTVHLSHWHQKRFPLLDYDLWFMKWKLVNVYISFRVTWYRFNVNAIAM